ncbi:MAG TPA: tetratricopeptide repeat protein [Candidatus Polarisedimenticolaceae bacterium]
MKQEQVAFLAGGLVLGIALGFGGYHAWYARPGTPAAQPREDSTSPMGPSAMGGAPPMTMPPPAAPSAGGGAPMVQVVNTLKKRLQDDPKDLDAAMQLAHLHHDAGMWQQAIPFYERALEIRPGDPDLLTDLGICHQELKAFDKALDLFGRASKASASHWQSLYNTVVVGLQVGDLPRAREALTRLEQVNPQAPNLASLRTAVEGRAR